MQRLVKLELAKLYLLYVRYCLVCSTKRLRQHLLSTAAIYGNRKAPEKLEGLEFNGSKSAEVIALN
jgi:hypothetical protein